MPTGLPNASPQIYEISGRLQRRFPLLPATKKSQEIFVIGKDTDHKSVPTSNNTHPTKGATA